MFIQVCQSKKKLSELNAAITCVLDFKFHGQNRKEKDTFFILFTHIFMSACFTSLLSLLISLKAFVNSSEDVL